mgnify:CR=1 FL=1|tara:strand:+ start:429 stop:671 length:243 start_codon:yes stop_codon:yes gene_type:complete
MKISDILSKNNVFLDLELTSKKSLFKEISQKISEKAKVNNIKVLEKTQRKRKIRLNSNWKWSCNSSYKDRELKKNIFSFL